MTFCLFSLAANKTVLHLLIVKLIDSLSTGSELNFKANPCLQGFSQNDDSRARLLFCSHVFACCYYCVYQEHVTLPLVNLKKKKITAVLTQVATYFIICIDAIRID